MANVLSFPSPIVLSRAIPDQNSAILAYDSLVNVSNTTATSQTIANPIANLTNPATAFSWVSGVADYSGSVSYDAANQMQNPFNPEGWAGAGDPDGTITNITMENPSGSPNIGLSEQVGGGIFFINSNASSPISVVIGDIVYISVIAKESALTPSIGLRFVDGDSGSNTTTVIRVSDGAYLGGTAREILFTQLEDGYSLIQIKKVITQNDTDSRASILMTSGSAVTAPPIGSQLYMQASFFGKADDWPAVVEESGVKINVNTAGRSVDYIGIAKHNLNQAGLLLEVKYDGQTVVQPSPISSKQAILFLQSEATPTEVELIITGATIPPSIAVLYIGETLKLERNIYVGHTPITYSRDRKVVNGVSENGQFLGEVVVRQTNTTSVSLSNLTPMWYRDQLDPFFAKSPRVPAFFAWRPQKYSTEVGYCWVEGKPSVSNQRSNGMMECSWNFRGLV